MKHLGTVQLETERLILRRFNISDTQAIFDNWAKDDEVTKYLMWPAHTSIEITKSLQERRMEHYINDKFYQWAIILKENGDEPIGIISIVDMKEDIDMMQIGYTIGRKWWNQGITSEAFKEVIRFLIEEVGVKRIESRHDPRNPNSGKVMLKCGLLYEGTLRKADRNNQGICDTCMYGLLAEDYYKGLMKIIKKYPNHSDSILLMEELSKTLAKITGDSGKNSFDPKDVCVPRSLFVVAYDHEEKAIGCGAFRPINEDVAEVKRMFSKEKSKGVGGEILSYLEKEAYNMGYSKLWLETRIINERAVEFYKKRGYHQISNYGKYEGNEKAICFEKILKN